MQQSFQMKVLDGMSYDPGSRIPKIHTFGEFLLGAGPAEARQPGEASGDVDRSLPQGRRIVWLGFASLLVVMAAMGFGAAGSLQETARTNEALIRGFRERDRILDELRETMALSGSNFRDYVSEMDPAKREVDKAKLETLRRRTTQLLDYYERRLQPGQAALFPAMRARFRAYLASLMPATNWSAEARGREESIHGREVIESVNADVQRLQREINQWNQNQLDAGEQEVATEHDRLRRRLVIASATGITIGAVLAIVVTLLIRRLENEAGSQYRKVVHARQQLRALTGKLHLAQEEERKRLSRELHDEVGQSMSAMLIDLAKLESLIPQDVSVRAQLNSLRSLAESNVKAVRNMALLLRPSMLDDLGLVAALKWQGRETARRTGLRVGVDVDQAADQLPEAHRTCVYRLVQESLNNVLKHSKATTIQVLVRRSADAVEVFVEDNGEGFDPSEKGAGLLGMEERAARLRGTLRVESKAGSTIVKAFLPMPDPECIGSAAS